MKIAKRLLAMLFAAAALVSASTSSILAQADNAKEDVEGGVSGGTCD